MATSERIRAVARARMQEAELVDQLEQLEAKIDAAKTNAERVKAEAARAVVKDRLAKARKVIRPRRKSQPKGLVARILGR